MTFKRKYSLRNHFLHGVLFEPPKLAWNAEAIPYAALSCTLQIQDVSQRWRQRLISLVRSRFDAWHRFDAYPCHVALLGQVVRAPFFHLPSCSRLGHLHTPEWDLRWLALFLYALACLPSALLQTLSSGDRALGLAASDGSYVLLSQRLRYPLAFRSVYKSPSPAAF